MKRLVGVLVVLGCWLSSAAAAERPKPLVSGLKNPTAVAAGPGGRVYISEAGTGRVLVVEGDKAVPFATGFDHPQGLVGFQQWLFVADKKGVWRIDMKGKATEFAPEKAFPTSLSALKGITVDETGALYVSDEEGGAI